MQKKSEMEVYAKLTTIRLAGRKSSKQSSEIKNITNLYDAQQKITKFVCFFL